MPRVLLLLICWLLPACGTLPSLSPKPAAPPVAKATGEDLFEEAETHYRHQAYRRALPLYRTYLQRHPKGDYALRSRQREAELLGLTGDWQGSLRRYQALLNQPLDRDEALKVRYGIGRAYFKLGQYQKGAEVLENLTATDLPRPLRFSTKALLAEISLKQGRVEQAFARLRLAAEDLPAGDREWFEDLKKRLVEQATAGELEELVARYRDSPLTAPLLLRLAQQAREQGRSTEAQKWLNTLKERFPQSQEAASGEGLAPSHQWSVGCLLPLSGEFADASRRVKQGMELAAAGAPLELLFRDTAGNPANAAEAVQELAKNPRVLALLGPLTSGCAQAAAQAAQSAGLPLIALSQKADLPQVGSYIFQAFLTARLQVRDLLRYTLSQPGIKRYAILAPDSSYGRTFSQLFHEELVSQGGQLVAQENYGAETRNFTPALDRLLGLSGLAAAETSAFEALFIPDDAPTVAAIASQLAGSRLAKVQLLGTNLVHPSEAQESEARALEGILFPDGFFAGDPDAAVQTFITAYRQKYGETPNYLAAQGYLMVKVMAKLLASPGPLSRSELPSRLLALKKFPELPWFQGFAPDRQEDLALYILTIKDGQLQMAPTAR